MKSIFWALVACAMLSSCKDSKKGPKLDPYTQITLNGTTAVPTAASSTKTPPAPPYSIQTVAKWAGQMSYKHAYAMSTARGFYDRDIDKGKLKVGEARDVVEEDGQGGYKLGYLAQGLSDVVCVVNFNPDDLNNWGEPGKDRISDKFDTVAYIPNAVIQRAEAAIKTAFDAGDYDECMRLFEEAYVFIPTTGAEWRALKAAGIE